MGDSKDVVLNIDQATPGIDWHSLSSTTEVFKQLNTSADGLSSATAAELLEKYGPNRLTPAKKRGILLRIWDQCNSVLVWVLFISSIICGALQQWAEVGLILGVIIINVAIGLFQEGKAEKAADAIKNMLSSNAEVLRDGERVSVDAADLVPGDIVLLKSGDKVPADLRLIDVTNLSIQEALLTGESVPVAKNLKPVAVASALGDRKCMAYSATTVMSGKGVGVVVETGDRAEIGKISKMVSEVQAVKTNLQYQLEIIGRWITSAVAVVAVIAFLLAKFARGENVPESFKVSIAIAVAIMPAGLPAIVTICLAIGTTVMANNHAIIRQLPAVETLGSLNVICSDKTGTLTKNEMTVVAVQTADHLYRVTGVGYAPEGHFTTTVGQDLMEPQLTTLRGLLEGTILCNDSVLSKSTDESGRVDYVPNGAPTEVALITAACKLGLDMKERKEAKPRLAAVPFESEHKFMATVHDDGGRRVLYVKGAPDRLMPLCTGQVAEAGVAAFDEKLWRSCQEELSSQGLRVLALCRTVLPESQDLSKLNPEWIIGHTPFLEMVAMAAILDPPRDEAVEAVKVAHHAGINVKMITGDHALTALAIGRMLGIEGAGAVYTGPEVDAMSDEELASRVLDCNIFARASPENKLRIVRALKSRHQIVAMTGDGVNDAPALKAADIGVAMGITGTDVSKEAAKMVLADDNFASIVAAVKEGRRVWDNLRKILVFNLPVNFGQGLSILWAYIIGFEHAPLTALQVLYINLVTAVTMGIMLAAEPAEPRVMDHPPRRAGKRLLGKLIIWRTFAVSSLLVVFVLACFEWSGLEGRSLKQRRGEAFNILIFGEIGYCITTRFIKASTLHRRTFFGNPWCYISIGLTIVLNVFLTYTPGVNGFFHMEGIAVVQWARALATMVLVYLLVEAEKALVDPVFAPMIRPLVQWFRNHAPKCMRNPVV